MTTLLERTHASEERLRLATDAAALGVWVWHIPAGRITAENDRMREILGYDDPDGWLDSTRFFDDFVSPADAEAFHAAVQATLSGARPLRFEGRFHRMDDSELRWVELTGIVHCGPDGAPLRLVGTATDISMRKLLEYELRSLAETLALEARRKTEFIATLAHELRNPLAPLSNALHAIRAADYQETIVRRLGPIMERQLVQMVRLVDDLLDVARLANGKLSLRTMELPLPPIVEQAVESCRSVIDAAGHQLTVHVPAELPVLIVDPVRMGQVFSNLITNSAKYTPPGGRIDVFTQRNADMATVTVTDTGIGLAPDAIGTVFDMFSQVGASADMSRGGLGIGLALVRQLVALHGGTTSCASAGIGHGCSFTVSLPLPASERQAA